MKALIYLSAIGWIIVWIFWGISLLLSGGTTADKWGLGGLLVFIFFLGLVGLGVAWLALINKDDDDSDD